MHAAMTLLLLPALAALQLFAQSAEACSRLHVEVVDGDGTL